MVSDAERWGLVAPGEMIAILVDDDRDRTRR
jgi:hypothetical protein